MSLDNVEIMSCGEKIILNTNIVKLVKLNISLLFLRNKFSQRSGLWKPKLHLLSSEDSRKCPTILSIVVIVTWWMSWPLTLAERVMMPCTGFHSWPYPPPPFLFAKKTLSCSIPASNLPMSKIPWWPLKISRLT